MQSLNQGIYFEDKKGEYQNLVKPNKEKIVEGFQEGMDNEKLQQFNDQIIEFGGSIKGDADKQKSMTLEEAKKECSKNGDYFGFEYHADSKKCLFRSLKDGVLPKNGGKIPTLKHQKGWQTFLKVNNGMPECRQQTIGEGNAIEKVQAAERREMQKLENEYNLLLGQYKTLYKKYLDEVVAATAAGNTSMQNQVRTGPNGRQYYIGGTGVIREFDPNSWNKRDKGSCPDSTGKITQDEINQLTQGTNMGQGEACRTGGYVAKSQNGTMAWISPKGTSHIFADYLNRHGTCPSRYVNTTNAQFDAIPKGSQYTAQNTCELIKLDTGTGKQVVALNERLQALAAQMKDLVSNSDHSAASLSVEKKKVIKGMAKTMDDLKYKRSEINKLRQDIITARATAKSQRIQVDTLGYKYVAWTLAGLTLGIMAVRQIIQAK
jgi:hypothetical protein